MRYILFAAALLAAGPVFAGEITITPTAVTEWKPVYGRVETRDLVPARTRIGGTITKLLVSEGDTVEPGQRIALIRDDKITYQISSYDAQLAALRSQQERARSELSRGKSLIEAGVITVQRLEQLQAELDVTTNQIAATEAQRSVVVRQQQEGEVLAPAAGRVLTVPTTRGAVVMAGETVATVGSGGFFLRLAVPERHAPMLRLNSSIRIQAGGAEMSGRLAKIYPRIESGRVVADVEVADLDETFVNARVLVQLPVGQRDVLLVPASAIETRSGIDFVTVLDEGKPVLRAVVPGERLEHASEPAVEILTGLSAGEKVGTP
ncbi:efflux RND transporter periplasmic adaptor subunit [Rhizobium sp. ARZ01]|uniref:efflux RND transporter periplasmic adaptor subunit n=1 Tax=Rhizobium sp. ARZ01 TaxID=2769313 RepID=UPI00178755E2|nr:efflux RND transporter periplasmic adaptor subunit [Rhizobium sp. ARZ01]MBD9373647.1 efflux RND transporter periplasmic adaptor subunit [Rhizobium sp. ARZ01]